MTDIHTHILPNIDDGSENVLDSVKILNSIKNAGYDNIIFTPHYYFKTTIDEFQKTVDTSLSSISNILTDLKLNYKLASEVYISHSGEIAEEIVKLAIKDTKYILIELSFSDIINEAVFQKIEDIISYLNLIPVIAHIERYPIVLTHPVIAYKLKQMGCILQMNSSSLFGKHLSKLSCALLKHNLIDVIASDVHNSSKRPFMLPQGLELLQKEFGTDLVSRLTKNADSIFNGKAIITLPFTNVKKFLAFYL